jgi:hypothetical protein
MAYILIDGGVDCSRHSHGSILPIISGDNHINHQEMMIMNKKISVLLCMAALLPFGNNAMAASVSATATATVRGAISITNIGNGGSAIPSNLAFGIITPSSTDAGTVTISAAGVRSAGGGVTLVSSTVGAARFRVAGDTGLACTISLPANNIVIITKGGGINMAINDFTSSLTGSSLTIGGTPSSNEFTVGGTLSLVANQPSGDYGGTFTVTANYN